MHAVAPICCTLLARSNPSPRCSESARTCLWWPESPRKPPTPVAVPGTDRLYALGATIRPWLLQIAGSRRSGAEGDRCAQLLYPFVIAGQPVEIFEDDILGLGVLPSA
jgi:hypothetical protein